MRFPSHLLHDVCHWMLIYVKTALSTMEPAGATAAPVLAVLGAGLDDELAVGLAVLQKLQGFWYLLERYRLEDEGVYLAGFVELDEGLVSFCDEIGHDLVVEAPVKADDRVVFHEGVVGRGVGDSAGREPHDDDAALEGDALPREIEDVTAYRVEDNIRPTAFGRFFDGVDEALFLVVHGYFSSELPADFDLLRASGRGDHTRPRGVG